MLIYTSSKRELALTLLKFPHKLKVIINHDLEEVARNVEVILRRFVVFILLDYDDMEIDQVCDGSFRNRLPYGVFRNGRMSLDPNNQNHPTELKFSKCPIESNSFCTTPRFFIKNEEIQVHNLPDLSDEHELIRTCQFVCRAGLLGRRNIRMKDDQSHFDG